MNKFCKLVAPMIMATTLCSCGHDEPVTFDLLGKWGMISGIITDADGTTNRFDSLPDGRYYETREYKPDGTFIRVLFPDAITTYGVYVYNNSNQEMAYKYDGEKYYRSAFITIHSPTEMTLFTDYGSIGEVSQYFVKI